MHHLIWMPAQVSRPGGFLMFLYMIYPKHFHYFLNFSFSFVWAVGKIHILDDKKARRKYLVYHFKSNYNLISKEDQGL